ncbi:probable methyltransferase-like protein 24 [Ruditapes philippinarum]|uniref:probable methyltransferase-like protein 24 n=1 Tax=Ruditapes philippinarum TaxID=129788 RepID=UPI00295A6E22|nr:probable methyltransferase-like protein 24 [Ruditapes philippinarum]
MVLVSRSFVSRNTYTLAITTTLIVILTAYGYNNGISMSMFQHDRYSIFDRDINESLLYRIPSDNQLDGMDDNTLYHTFWKYINLPQYRCYNRTRLGPTKSDKGKNICADDKFKPAPSSCLVYSFGSNFDFQFEEAVWRTYKCEIHTFDPSRSVTGVTIPNEVNFHLIGLSGKSYIRSSPENWRTLQKESRTDWKMQTLNEIIKSLNHTNRNIDILKIDIEGWEWSTLPEIITSGVLPYVKQICIEIHFGYGFQVLYKAKKPVAVKFTSEKWGNVEIPDQLKVLRNLNDTGFRIFMIDPIRHWGTRHVHSPALDVDTLMELSLVNINKLAIVPGS